ncbi:IZH3 [Candida jiufengensis]|uniref:IZH3 n=1 Tax=Candida jiufengensis TaxID=497108 RepID=UPI0022249C01|nr:IZH3 [Candida jiufengensis]KAI5950273.1 IZH3 [Candida jiufengensis]
MTSSTSTSTSSTSTSTSTLPNTMFRQDSQELFNRFTKQNQPHQEKLKKLQQGQNQIQNSSSSTSLNSQHQKRNSSSYFSIEELLIEKLDYFVTSIEIRLNNFEQYFNLQNDVKKSKLIEKKEEENGEDPSSSSLSSSRRGSSSSLNNLKEISLLKLNTVRDRLYLIKKNVLSKGFTNLESLYNLLDDQYNYLFNELSISYNAIESDEEDQEDISQKSSSSSTITTREMLSNKIINTISYFDAKLIKIDDYLKEKYSIFDEDDNNTIMSNPNLRINLQQSSSEILDKLKYFNFNRALKNAEKFNMIHYYELPLLWRENKFIINGYRFSLKNTTILKSVFKFHNETMNIWSHLIGFFGMLYISLVHFPSTKIFQNNSFYDNLTMYAFLGAAITCLVSSSIWHTYSCCAHFPTRSNFACIDYSGITILISFSIVTVEYCALYNHPTLLIYYMIFSVLCCISGFILNWSSYFDKPECRSLRIAFFVGLSCSGASALLCQSYYEGLLYSLKFFIPLCYKSFLFYGIGVVFYGGLIPERWRYDIIIEEHNQQHKNFHTYDAKDILEDKIGHSGEEEINEIQEEIEQINEPKEQVIQTLNQSEQSSEDNDEKKIEDEKFSKLLNKHFKNSPIKSPYANNFMSLWWVDYMLSSHNIWHVCVVLGILGHYSCVLEMFNSIKQ